MENLKDQKAQFDQLILESMNPKKSHIKQKTVYYDDAYYTKLTTELKKRNLFESFSKRELQETHKGTGLIKMCSVASSSRLCFINFVNDNQVKYECSLTTGTKGKAQLDAFKENTYYECKCHEIFDNHNTDNNHLRLAYKKNLQKYFGINYQEKDEDYCKLTLRNFGINDDRSIYDLRFDMKQLLCHLFGIAKNGGGTLQYIFFTPKKDFVETNPICKEIYKTLNDEIKSIWNCAEIKKMCKENNIHLPEPMFIDVSTIKDIVLQNIL